MRTTLRNLTCCFDTMAKHGSLTQASIELGISDAAVSQRIKALEKYLGTKLYEARGGKVRLTEAGQRTMVLATRIFDDLAEFTDENGNSYSAVDGGVSVASNGTDARRAQQKRTR